MLFPMLLPQGHNFAMMVVTFAMISEHMEHPRFPRWRLYISKKLARIVFAQARIGLRRVPGMN
jgi:hypothetical protein